MLKRLSVKNYALINDLDISFREGYTAITGETGAGKSILLGALSLVLGQRADGQVLLNRDVKCVVECEFDIQKNSLEEFFLDHDLDFEPATIIRREISPEGKSRAFVNDTPVNLGVLKELGSKLVDIHSQHESLDVVNAGFQLDVLDAMADHKEVLAMYQLQFELYRNAGNKLKNLEAANQNSQNDLDYYSFLKEELDEANLSAGEEEDIEKELQLLNHASDIKSVLSHADQIFNGDENSVIAGISSVISSLGNIAKYDSSLTDFRNRLNSANLEIKDVASDIGKRSVELELDPARIELLTSRLNTINHLLQKHHKVKVVELISAHKEIIEKLDGIAGVEDEIAAVKKEIEKIKSELDALAEALTLKRLSIAPVISQEITAMLVDLGMPHARLKVEVFTSENDFNKSGKDKVSFLFSANKGIDFRELGTIVSGGEMSRLMLCIKALIASKVNLPTIVFDEIDSGISGETAFRVSKLIGQISSRHQVIAITHLPQIASRGAQHLFVYKQNDNNRTNTAIRELAFNERVTEIAKMIGGEVPSSVALENARELLAN